MVIILRLVVKDLVYVTPRLVPDLKHNVVKYFLNGFSNLKNIYFHKIVGSSSWLDSTSDQSFAQLADMVRNNDANARFKLS